MMHVGCGSELLPERRDRSCEHRTNPCCRRRARDHTRGQATLLLYARVQERKSRTSTRDLHTVSAAPAGHAVIPRTGIRYEYRSLKRFAQELGVEMPCDWRHQPRFPSKSM